MGMNLLKGLLPIALLTLGGVGTWLLIQSREPTPQQTQTPEAPGVAIQSVTPERAYWYAHSQGTVRSQHYADVVSEISGKVVFVHPKLHAGQALKKGETLARLDTQDQQLALARAQASLAKAQQHLAQVMAESQQAQTDWQRLGKTGSPSPLSLKQPQVAEAKANIKAARAERQSAELNLARAHITAPISGRLLNESLVLGQYLTPGHKVATLYSQTQLEVALPLHQDLLDQLPSASSQPKVTLTSLNGQQSWQAQIAYDQGSIDEKTHLVTWIAHVAQSERPPRLGQFLRAKIRGSVLENVFKIPEQALRNDRQVYLLDENNTLKIQEVEIATRYQGELLIGQGLKVGDRVILSPLDIAVSGMALTPTRSATP